MTERPRDKKMESGEIDVSPMMPTREQGRRNPPKRPPREGVWSAVGVVVLAGLAGLAAWWLTMWMVAQ